MSHVPIISLWPSIVDFAADLAIGYDTAKGMKRRGVIPSGYWVRVVDAAVARGLTGVTYQRLAEMVALPAEAAE